MSKLFVFATLTLAAVSSVSALTIPRKAPPPGWATGYLEDYTNYHNRYLALKCQDFHGKPFFDDCCHPLLATENLKDNRPAKCNPDSPEYCTVIEGDNSDDPVVKPSDTAAPPTKTKPPPNSWTPTSTSPAASASDNSDDPVVKPSDTNRAAVPPTKTKTPPNNWTPTSTSPAASASDKTGGDYAGGVATYFTQNGNMGACGERHTDSDLIAAMDVGRYGDTGVRSPLCDKYVEITNTQNQKSVVVQIVDACPTCLNENSIDLSPRAFELIGDKILGVLDITWHYV